MTKKYKNRERRRFFMNLKKVISLATLISGITLGGKSSLVHAIEYEPEWETSWGGSGSDFAESIIQTSDGGFLMVGDSNSTDLGFKNKGGRDAIIVKYDSEFNQEWINSWGGSDSDNNVSVIESSDGGFVVAGFSHSGDAGFVSKGRCDATLAKYDREGNQLWLKNWGGNLWDTFYSIVETEDEGVIVVGSSSSTNAGFTNKGDEDVIVVKYDRDGNQEWIKNWGGKGYDEPMSAIKTSDGGVVVVGRTASYNNNGNDQGFIFKIDRKGSIEWEDVLNGDGYDSLEAVIETSDGGFLAVGDSDSTNLGFKNQGGSDAVLIKYDAAGNRVWIKSWGNSRYENFSDVIETKEGGFIVVGASRDYPDYDGVIVKFSYDMEEEWTEIWENTGYSGVSLIEELTNNRIMVIGCEDSNILIKTYRPKTDADIQINGSIETLIADVTIPSVSPDLVVDPNSPDGAMSPEFSIENQSTSPIRLELKTFEQTTNSFNDVLPDKYDSWEGLNKTQSQDIALGLIAKEGEGWQRLTNSTSYVSGHTEHEIGVIKPTSQVNFEFDVHHGRAFSESKTVQYKLVFVFDLLS